MSARELMGFKATYVAREPIGSICDNILRHTCLLKTLH